MHIKAGTFHTLRAQKWQMECLGRGRIQLYGETVVCKVYSGSPRREASGFGRFKPVPCGLFRRTLSESKQLMDVAASPRSSHPETQVLCPESDWQQAVQGLARVDLATLVNSLPLLSCLCL